MEEGADRNPLTEVNDVWLKGAFLGHFIFTVWGGQGFWSPDSYLFYNLLFFITIFWSIHSKNSADASFFCFVIDASSIVLDVITISMYFPDHTFGSSEHFSVAMAILNLFVRPISCYALYQIWSRRSGGSQSHYTSF